VGKWACRRSQDGAKKVKSHKEISLFCDLNSIYSGIDLKLKNTVSKKIIYSLMSPIKLQKNKASKLLVNATASMMLIIIYLCEYGL
jgi:hypothetical protein